MPLPKGAAVVNIALQQRVVRSGIGEYDGQAEVYAAFFLLEFVTSFLAAMWHLPNEL